MSARANADRLSSLPAVGAMLHMASAAARGCKGDSVVGRQPAQEVQRAVSERLRALAPHKLTIPDLGDEGGIKGRQLGCDCLLENLLPRFDPVRLCFQSGGFN